MTNSKFSRREFIKLMGVSAGGIAIAGIGLPLFMGEKEPIFDPNDSYWSLVQPPANPPLQQDLVVDVAVIGGGYTGLSAALHLAKVSPGLNVALLEARQVGHGASGRHGGMVLPQTGVESFEIAHDIDTHHQMYQLTVKGMNSLQKLVASTGIECDLQLDGFVHAFLDEDDWDYYENYVAQVQKVGMPLDLWDEAETAEALGTDVYAGSVFDPNGGSVHAMKLVKALKTAGESAGVQIYENSPVVEISESETIRLRMGNGNHTVHAKSIVLATNAYTSKLGYFKHQVMPIHAQTAVTPPLSSRQLADIGWESRLPFFDSRNMLYHVVLTPDNRIAIGGGSAEYCFRNDLHFCGSINRISDLMLNELIRIYPALKGIQFDHVWNGLLGMTFDSVPAVGVMGRHRNIYYGLGYSGEGVNLSFVFGEVIAALFQGKNHDWLATPYADYALRFIPPEPFRWLGVQGMLNYYKWADRGYNSYD